MTTVIDHAIAIPTKQINVWELLSQIQENHVWQSDCEQVAFLTTMRSGRGTRWRNISPSGREYIMEITAWYDGLGYEYTIVDGVPYKDNRGRLRLQEAPEGTIVQWTFSYEASGLLGGLRNAMGTKRSVENDIIDSLRNLYNYLKHLRGEERFAASDSKSFMQDAPDVEERAHYQPRYPSIMDSDKINKVPEIPKRPEQRKADTSQEMPKVPSSLGDEARYMPPSSYELPSLIPEPPVAEDDTRPNPTTSGEIAAVPDKPAKDDAFMPRDRYSAPDSIEEPSFLKYMPPPPEKRLEELPKPLSTADSAYLPKESAKAWEEKPSTEPNRPKTADAPIIPEPPVGKLDSAQVSVFELFGMPKPSATQEVRASKGKEPSRILASMEAKAIMRRRGLRTRLQDKHRKLRLPLG